MTDPNDIGTTGDTGGAILLYTIASELLDAAVNCLEGDGLETPARRYVDLLEVEAPVKLDGNCQSQITCSVSQLAMGLPTELVQARAGRASAPSLWEATFKLTLLRCHPLNESGLSDPDKIDGHAKAHLRDGWCLSRCLVQKWHEKLLFPSFPLKTEDVKWQAAKPIPPRGGIRGWTLSMSTSVHSHWPTEP